MRRKNWVSLICGGLLFVATALPAAAAGGAPQLRPALLAWMVDWMGWAGGLSGVQTPSPVESKTAAGEPQGGELPGLGPATSCELCNNGELDHDPDPDG